MHYSSPPTALIGVDLWKSDDQLDDLIRFYHLTKRAEERKDCDVSKWKQRKLNIFKAFEMLIRLSSSGERSGRSFNKQGINRLQGKLTNW